MTTHPVSPPIAVDGRPWQQDWQERYPCDMPSTVPYPRAPVTVLLERASRQYPNHPACTLYGEATTYAELDLQARRLARSLADLGARRGRHVGLLLPNTPEYLAALQAVWLTGATALQLSPLMVAEEADHWLQATGCHLIITLDLLAPIVMGSLRQGGPLEHVVLTSLAPHMTLWTGMLYRLERLRRNGYLRLPDDAHRHRFDLLCQAAPVETPAEIVPEEDVAVLAPTGGTTGSPKAVMLTHRNLVANALQLRAWDTSGPDGGPGVPDTADSVLGVLPFFHAYGLSVSVLSTWARAGTLHLLPRFQTRPVLQLMLERKPTLVPAVPAMLHTLNVLMRGKKVDLSFIRAVISGASALSAETRQEFEKHGVLNLVEGYGLTEASPVTHANPPGSGNRPGTIGLPVADTEARVIDPDTGAEVATGEVGELMVRGPQVMKGYYNNPTATALALRDGWLATGDLARRDRDGYYTLVDRKRDIIKTSGFLVFPAEVEELMRAFPGVAEAAVIGVPDQEHGELVLALVVPSSGQKLDIHALAAHCRQHLGKQKRPRQIEVVQELPKNFLGKVLRRKLREQPHKPVEYREETAEPV
jgi:long-chain acyl-CoA synthetase